MERALNLEFALDVRAKEELLVVNAEVKNKMKDTTKFKVISYEVLEIN
jgi:hypothetical protein